MGKVSVLVGEVYGKLTVRQDLGVYNKNRRVLCECVCGVVIEVLANNIKRGNTTSCGCMLSEYQKEKWDSVYAERGHGKHDQGTPEYLAWRNMLTRCYNTTDISYPNYGGVGITVCDRWRQSFEEFLKDVGSRPDPTYSLDRFNVNLGYCKDNVGWKDQSWQSRNKGKMSNCLSNYKGVSFEGKKWRSRIKDKHGTPVSLGSYDDEVLAALVVDEFLIKEFGEDCPWTNRKLGLIGNVNDTNKN